MYLCINQGSGETAIVRYHNFYIFLNLQSMLINFDTFLVSVAANLESTLAFNGLG